jgi:hypothetical protein
VVDLDDSHGEGDGHKRDDQVLQLRKEERENKKPRRSRQIYQIGFCFGDQDTIESVTRFRIDSRTIKAKGLLSATR